MVELTLEQRRELSQSGQSPSRIVDPETNTTYLLVEEAAYNRLRSALDFDDDEFIENMSADAMRLLGREGWDDPSMDIYNDLDPRLGP